MAIDLLDEMILSHKHKFIFLKTSKTAGTSIEIALSRFCGDEDIITPILANDELIRFNLGYRGPQNYQWPSGPDDGAAGQAGDRRGNRFFHHISAREVRRIIGPEKWNSYYKFCFERNPWDRFISLYYWRFQSEPRPGISEILDSDIPLALKEKGFDLYTIDGEIAVDRVCLFENLKDELENVRTRIGLPEPIDLPWAKSSHREDRRSYREILNEQQKERISRLFSREISLFGYAFDRKP